VDLIYIDPPFASSASYKRRLTLKGRSSEPDDRLTQVQYLDTWSDGAYLQFLYERLLLLRELMSEKGTLYLHCDTHQNYRIRMVLDEVFGARNFRNEIAWCYTGPSNTHRGFPAKHDTLYRYTRSDQFCFRRDRVRIPYRKLRTGNTHGIFDGPATLDAAGKVPEDWWADITPVARLHRTELLGYPTQKPRALLERIIASSSEPGQLVLDAFCGSGTTLEVARHLERRCLGIDDNPGAIRLSLRRMLGAVIGSKLTDQASNPGIELLAAQPQVQTDTLDIRVENGQLEITDFKPPDLLDTLDEQGVQLREWRELVDAVLVDTRFDGQSLCPTIVDLPDGDGKVSGCYPLPPDSSRLRVQVVDIFGQAHITHLPL
jgi:hypothetical protein